MNQTEGAKRNSPLVLILTGLGLLHLAFGLTVYAPCLFPNSFLTVMAPADVRLRMHLVEDFAPAALITVGWLLFWKRNAAAPRIAKTCGIISLSGTWATVLMGSFIWYRGG